MDIETLHHISLRVTDLERSMRFYAEVLGLTPIERPPFKFPGAWFSLGNRELHLIGDVSHQSNRPRSIDTGDTHFAIRVRSFARAMEELRGLGYREEADGDDPRCMVVRPNSIVGYPQAYILDPDRYLIEINAERLDA
ncbi:MAG TPA: VOC family protein [Geminicoccus sp.]|jgi:catechol 2,3-dioxygenase-like lactoylglutathione lyase family enzyme|uniref:VOC family protein n=1 Tax=Geminicoccus sp. TaxID=2024832 RepID=UPI002E349B8C|nr:VOC family protein [Geminicoccus sp.]HEX2528379.1 VOC family protein [Geminicoccus sp.]